LDPFSASSKFGFIRLALTRPTEADLSVYAYTTPFEAFGHAAFPRRYAYQAVALALTPATTTPKPGLPNQPYTPTLTSLALDYTAQADFVPGDPHAAESFLATLEREGVVSLGRGKVTVHEPERLRNYIH